MRRVAFVAALAACAAVLAACGQETPEEEPGETPRLEQLYLDFDDLEADEPVTEVPNEGTAEVEAQVSTNDGAEVEPVDSPAGGSAIRFPSYTGTVGSPVAVLVVHPGDEGLDPGDSGFVFGASFNLDARSEGTTSDNGNNLVQRGNYEGPAQFKLQVDGGKPSCRVLGEDGEVQVQGSTAVTPGAWYAVTCRRTNSEVILRLEPLAGGQPEEWRKSGPTGRLDFDDVPLTIGGKTDPEGVALSASDEFNGAVDNVFYRGRR